jgi:hypothetical protein
MRAPQSGRSCHTTGRKDKSLSFVPVSFHFDDSRERWLSCSWIAKNDTSENAEPTRREGKWTMADGQMSSALCLRQMHDVRRYVSNEIFILQSQ